MRAPRVNDLLSDRRLDEIEEQIRREFPRLPAEAHFNTYIEPEGYVERSGLEIPVPPRACVAIVVPNLRWPEKEPQFRSSVGRRWLREFEHHEKVRTRIVQAPDVALNDFRAVAPKAIEAYEYSRDLMT